jgi:hypothetical protein
MKALVDRLISSLRDELQQYGEMLALLEQQQELVMARASDELVRNVAAVNGQSSVIQVARRQRDERRQELAGALNLPAAASFEQILPALPPDYRGLVKALVDENNSLLQRVQERARQNHLMLRRSVELIQGVLRTMFPSDLLTIYDNRGRVSPPSPPSRPIASNESA